MGTSLWDGGFQSPIYFILFFKVLKSIFFVSMNVYLNSNFLCTNTFQWGINKLVIKVCNYNGLDNQGQ